MSVSIDRFLAAGTGPARLRTTLRAQTTPLRTLLGVLATVDTLQTPVPPTLLGGNLLAVLSDRLQHALQEPEPSRPQPPVRGGRTGFPTLPASSQAGGAASLPLTRDGWAQTLDMAR